MARVAAGAPGKPATVQPARGEIMKFGPGAAWAIANNVAKSVSLIQ